jgi:PAS domain S-box-containing protein
MERINKAILEAYDLDKMMSDVLDTVLSVFNCDRAWLIYPCDPDADSWTTAMERTRPEYQGIFQMGMRIPMVPEIVFLIRTLLESSSPVRYDPESENILPATLTESFGIQSQMAMAIYPKGSKPYTFGVHQCSNPRIWKPEEVLLMQSIGARLADALTGLVSYRVLQESEAKYRRIVDTAMEGIWVLELNNKTTFVNSRMVEMLGYSFEEMQNKEFADFIFAEDLQDHQTKLENRRSGISETYERRFRRKDGKTLWTLASATPIFNDDHQFNGSFAMFTDITDRKQNEMNNDANPA